MLFPYYINYTNPRVMQMLSINTYLKNMDLFAGKHAIMPGLLVEQHVPFCM